MATESRASEPILRLRMPPGPVQAVALVLHGGRVQGTAPVRPWSPAALRMIPFARRLTRRGAGDGLAVARLRHLVCGWNGLAQSPVADARWALAQLAERFPGVPIGLVGHSMGGRTALYVADDPAVRAVVGLAPWVEAEDRVEPVAGRQVLIMHGDRDRTTSLDASAAFAERARAGAGQVSFVRVRGDGHAMLRRAALWQDLAAGFITGALLGADFDGTDRASAANAIRQALSGQPALEV